MAKPEKKSVTPEVAKGIADIAGLDVNADRAAELAAQIQSVRESINAMDEVDLTDVEPATIFPLRQL
jgi:Asp-tRNA(Asn)/Glu-tRNA(Gln) amidotransferase C subunit